MLVMKYLYIILALILTSVAACQAQGLSYFWYPSPYGDGMRTDEYRLHIVGAETYESASNLAECIELEYADGFKQNPPYAMFYTKGGNTAVMYFPVRFEYHPDMNSDNIPLTTVRVKAGTIKGKASEDSNDVIENDEIVLNVKFPDIECLNFTKSLEYNGFGETEFIGSPSDIYVRKGEEVVARATKVTCEGTTGYVTLDKQINEAGIYEAVYPGGVFKIYDGERTNDLTVNKFKIVGSAFENVTTYPANNSTLPKCENFVIFFDHAVGEIEFKSGPNKKITMIPPNGGSYFLYNVIDFQDYGFTIPISGYLTIPGDYKIIIPAGSFKCDAGGESFDSEYTVNFTIAETSGIENVEITIPESKFPVYDLKGVKVADSTDNLPAGIYIIRQGDTSKKVAVQ